MKVKVSRNVPRGQVFLLSTETLEGDKIGCIYSVMIKMATTTNVQETTEDRRRQKYRKNNPKLVQLSNFKFSAKVSRKRSAADGIGGLVKNLVAQKVLMEPDVVMSNVREIKENIQTNCEISLHDKDDIK